MTMVMMMRMRIFNEGDYLTLNLLFDCEMTVQPIPGSGQYYANVGEVFIKGCRCLPLL